jgi:hypothetical protein
LKTPRTRENGNAKGEGQKCHSQPSMFGSWY